MKENKNSPVAAGKVDSEESYVEGLLVWLKVQDSDQYFLLRTVRAVLEPEGQVRRFKNSRQTFRWHIQRVGK